MFSALNCYNCWVNKIVLYCGPEANWEREREREWFFLARLLSKVIWEIEENNYWNDSCPFLPPPDSLLFIFNGQISAFFLFIFVFSTLHNWINWWKCRWCAWDSNLGQQNGRHRWIQWAMAHPTLFYLICVLNFCLRLHVFISRLLLRVDYIYTKLRSN